MYDVTPMTAIAWRLGEPAFDQITIAERGQRDGSVLYAVTHLSYTANKSGEWELEPIPSSRDKAYLERCRWADWTGAAEQAQRMAKRPDAARRANREVMEARVHLSSPRELPPMHNPQHTEPFAAFVQAMASELAANAHKGDRPGWLAVDPRVLVSEVLYHAAKLSYALRQYRQGDGPADQVLEFAADTANMALMVADSAGVLAPVSAEVS